MTSIEAIRELTRYVAAGPLAGMVVLDKADATSIMELIVRLTPACELNVSQIPTLEGCPRCGAPKIDSAGRGMICPVCME